MCKQSMKPYISDIMNDGQQMIFLLEVPIIEDGQFAGAVYEHTDLNFCFDRRHVSFSFRSILFLAKKDSPWISHPVFHIYHRGSAFMRGGKSQRML